MKNHHDETIDDVPEYVLPKKDDTRRIRRERKERHEGRKKVEDNWQ